MKLLLLLSLLATALHQVPAMPTSITELIGSYLLPPHDESESTLSEITTFATTCPDLPIVFHTRIVTSNIYQTDYKTDTITATNVVYHSRTRTMTVVDDVFIERSITKGITETMRGTVTDTKYITIQTALVPQIITLTESSTFVLPLTELFYHTETETVDNTETQTHYESGTIYSTSPILLTSFVTETIVPIPILETAVISSTYIIEVIQPPSTVVSTMTTTLISNVQSIQLRTPDLYHVTVTKTLPTVQYQTKTTTATTTSTDYQVTDIINVINKVITSTRIETIPVTDTVTQTLIHTIENVAETAIVKPTVSTRYSTHTETVLSTNSIYVTQTKNVNITSTLVLSRVIPVATLEFQTLTRTKTVRVPDVYSTQTIVAACTSVERT